MSDEIISVKSRPPTDQERDILDWFEQQEAESITTLEQAARQIISLVTAFYGVIFGVLVLSSDSPGVVLQAWWVTGLGGLAIVLLLGSLITALAVVLPQSYQYGESRLDEMKRAYRTIVHYKSRRLRWTVYLFGGGLVAFAGLILSLLAARL